MRRTFCDAMIARSRSEQMIFLTGDLGFMALEPLRDAMGGRFINAGVAEQNMVSVAAGLARQGFEPWVYSIAPFCYARPFEQIRNDVAFHDLPVTLVGNGGGYGYGVMGATHHAIEDYGVLLCLPNIRVYVPVFDEDVAKVVDRIGADPHPAYLRLGRGENSSSYRVPDYAPWRRLTSGDGPVVIAVGPLAGLYVEALECLAKADRPSLWALAELPLRFDSMPDELVTEIKRTATLCVAEEHVPRGSVASELLLLLAERSIPVTSFRHLHARAHHFARSGSQRYLRRQSHLDVEALLQTIADQARTPCTT